MLWLADEIADADGRARRRRKFPAAFPPFAATAGGYTAGAAHAGPPRRLAHARASAPGDDIARAAAFDAAMRYFSATEGDAMAGSPTSVIIYFISGVISLTPFTSPIYCILSPRSVASIFGGSKWNAG